MDLNIAVIDDHAQDIDTVISMIKKYLNNKKNLKINISSFYSGESFFKQFVTNGFHAVFVDICMDGMSGIELSRRFRQSDSNIAIIFMSTTTEYVFETFRATPFGYLIKPYSCTRLTCWNRTLHLCKSLQNGKHALPQSNSTNSTGIRNCNFCNLDYGLFTSSE